MTRRGYTQAAELELVIQVFGLATCGLVGKSVWGGSVVGPPVCGFGPALQSEDMSIVVCELVSAEVVLVTGVFGMDPFGVYSWPELSLRSARGVF